MTRSARRAFISWLAVIAVAWVMSFARPGHAAIGPTLEAETARIRAHLARVEAVLRAANPSALAPALRRERARNLDRLHAYRLRGEFPRNESFPGRRVPHFVDRDGRVCAVGYLIVASGNARLAAAIARTQNNAYLADIQRPDLDRWIARSGLTPSEHAMIQPSYGHTCMSQCVPTEYAIASTLVLVWAVSLASVNAFTIAQHRSRFSLSALAALAGLGAVAVGVGGIASASPVMYVYSDNPQLRGLGIVNVAFGAISIASGILGAVMNRSARLMPRVAIGASGVSMGAGMLLECALRF